MKLESAIKFKNGKKRNSQTGNIPVYGGNGILGYTSDYNAEKDNIIIGRVGAYCGCVYKNDNQCWVSDNAIVGNVKDGYDYNFMYYLLKNKNLNSLHIGSSHPLMTQDILNNIDVIIPNYTYQKKAAKVLSTIDKKVKLNNQINDNLHELLKNIYKNSFVDNKNDDWKRDRLGNYLNVERGLSYKGKFLSDSGVPMINLGNVMPDGVFRLEKNKYYTGEYKEKVTANPGDIVVANTDMTQNREVIGTPVIIPTLYKDKVIFSHHIYGLKNLKLPKMYVFYSLLTDEWNGIAGGNATGTTVLALPRDAIEEYTITIPDELTLNRFENLAENIQNKREQIIIENIELEQLRDSLLPKLMNGEIDLDKIEI